MGGQGTGTGKRQDAGGGRHRPEQPPRRRNALETAGRSRRLPHPGRRRSPPAPRAPGPARRAPRAEPTRPKGSGLQAGRRRTAAGGFGPGGQHHVEAVAHLGGRAVLAGGGPSRPVADPGSAARAARVRASAALCLRCPAMPLAAGRGLRAEPAPPTPLPPGPRPGQPSPSPATAERARAEPAASFSPLAAVRQATPPGGHATPLSSREPAGPRPRPLRPSLSVRTPPTSHLQSDHLHRPRGRPTPPLDWPRPAPQQSPEC